MGLMGPIGLMGRYKCVGLWYDHLKIDADLPSARDCTTMLGVCRCHRTYRLVQVSLPQLMLTILKSPVGKKASQNWNMRAVACWLT